MFYSVLSATSLPFACILCTVLEEGTVHVIFYTWMWPENQVSRVPGEVGHPKALFDLLYMKSCEFSYFMLVYGLIFVWTVLETGTVLTHSDVT